jgi:hypothetical protein
LEIGSSFLKSDFRKSRYGKELYAACQAYKHADREVRERILAIEGVWLKTETQVEAMRGLWDSLEEHLQIHQNLVLVVLREKLQNAINVVDGLDTATSHRPSLQTLLSKKGDSLRRAKYAAYAKEKLDQLVKDLDEWHGRFDPSWYLLARSAAITPALDQPVRMTRPNPSKELAIIQELRHAHRMDDGREEPRESIFFPKDYSIQTREKIPNTFAQTGHAVQQFVIIDSLHIAKDSDIQATTKDARNLARILARVDPTVFSLLTCQGVIKVLDALNDVAGFEFVFAVPKTFHKPRSLRTFLLEPNHEYPLDHRFRLARLLARSVSFLHASQVVHKNITPETVLLLADSSTDLESPFLVGFEKFRPVEGRTLMSGDTFWEKNLYRHPKRQGEHPEEEYKMQHDIYSIGVCLLELGLGTSFVRYEASSAWYATASYFIT